MDNFKANLLKGVSVGGLHCTCCNDCFGKSKKRLNREARARMKEEERTLVEQELIALDGLIPNIKVYLGGHKNETS